MKKIKFLSLMLVALMLFLFVGCGENNSNTEDLKKAKDYVHSMYKNDSEATTGDYELVSKAVSNGETFEVVWTVEVTEGDESDVTVSKNDKGRTVIGVNKYTETEVKYTLTFTIKDSKGNTLSQSYEKYIPAFKLTTWAEYAAAKEDELVNVKGVVTAFGGKAASVTIYFEDEDGAYYGYGLTVSEDVYNQLEVGKTILASGVKDLYNGTYEVVSGSFEILDEPKKEVEPKDITSLFDTAKDAKDENLAKLQGQYVTIKEVELDKADDKYYYFTKGQVSMYVYASTSSVFVDSTGMTALKDKVVKGQTANITGVVGMYNGAIQIIPLNTDAITHVTLELTDQEVVDKAKASVNAMNGQVYATDLDLFTTTPQGASVAWTSSNAELISNEGKLGNYPLEETLVKLTAVISCGEVKETVEIEVKVAALSKISIEEVQAKCDENNVTVWVEGQIVGLDSKGNAWIADETGVIYVYSQVFGEYSVGDCVKVIGNATQYAKNQYTRQIGKATVTKLEEKVNLPVAAKIQFSDLGTPESIDDVKTNRFYGKLVTITGYVSVRTSGTYTNIYIASENNTESMAVQYFYNATSQDAVKALDGKKVTITAPIYNWSSNNGWALGSYTELVEGEKEVAKTESAQTIEAVYALEKDAAVLVEGQVKFVNNGTGLFITDGANNLFVYTKNDLSNVKVGDYVVVSGVKGTYNGAPQVTNKGTDVLVKVTVKSTGTYTANPEVKTMTEVNALDYTDPKNFGKEYKVSGTPVVNEKGFVNFKVGEVTYSLYLSNADKETLKVYADKEVEIVVLTYNYYSKGSIINLFADVATVVEK